MRVKPTLSAAAMAAVFLAASPCAEAQDYWINTSGGLWSVLTNWSAGVIPSFNSDAYLGYDYGSTVFTNPGSLVVTVDHSYEVGNLYSKTQLAIDPNVSLNVSGNVISTAPIAISAGGSLYVGPVATAAQASLTGTVSLNDHAGNALLGGADVTLTSGSLIHGLGGLIAPNQLINQGTVASDGGGTITIGSFGSTQLDNTSGTLSASNNSILQLGSTSMTTGQLGVLQTSDTSRIYLGFIDNTGSLLDVSADGPSGSIFFNTITNGQIGGTALALDGGTVDNVEFLAHQTLQNATLNAQDSIKFDQGLTIGDGGKLVHQFSTLSVNFNVLFDASTAGGAVFQGYLQVLPGVLIHGKNGNLDATVVNQGTIASDMGGEIDANQIDNSAGVVYASNNSLLSLGTTTTGKLGNFHAYDTSHIDLGRLDNTNAVLDVASNGLSQSISFREIKGGRVAGTSLAILDQSRVQNVEFLAPQVLQAGRTLYVDKSGQFDQGLTLRENSTLETLNDVSLGGAYIFGPSAGNTAKVELEYSNLTLMAGSLVHGHGGQVSDYEDLLNQGTLVSDGGGLIDLNGDTSGPGVDNQGTMGASGSGSKLKIETSFMQESGGVLAFGIAGDSKYGVVEFDAAASLAGSVSVSLLGGYSPTVGTTWTVMDFKSGYTGTLTAPSGYSLVYGTDTIGIRAQAVPEPGCLAAVGAGIVVLVRRRWRTGL